MGTEEEAKKAPLDFKDVQNGPLTEANRQCRDIFCCLLFIACLFGMVYLTAYGYANGDPFRIYRPIDNAGNICGQGIAVGFPYLYISNPLAMTTKKYCVSSCPTASPTTPSSIITATGSISATITVDSSGSLITGSSPFSNAIEISYDSIEAAGRVCIPTPSMFTGIIFQTSSTNYADMFSSALQVGDLANFILDIKNNWQWLLAGVGICVLISFIWMFSLRCLVGCIVWLSIFGIILVFALAGVVFLYNAGIIKADGLNYNGYMNLPTSSGQSYYDIYGYISFALSGLFLLITLCCCSRIRLAVAVCKVAGQFVVGVCTVMLVPIIQALILLGFWAACLVVMVYLVSLGSFQKVNNSDFFTSITDYGGDLVNFYAFLFGTLWCNAMISAIGIFVIASSCVMWYYSHGPGQTLDFPILRSYKMVFRYHFGSLAFGSFILALVNFLQIILETFKKQAEASGADRGKCFEYLINCMRCFLACIERIVQFLNKTAYIQIAIRGKNFCMAAKDGFQMVWSNAIRFTIVSGVGEIIMFFGKLIIAALTTGCFYLLILYNPGSRVNVLQPIYLLIIIFIISYAIGVVFMAVYSLAMDTLLACFIIDESNQKGKGKGMPLFAPPELAELVDHE